jgi:hypothetical protein
MQQTPCSLHAKAKAVDIFLGGTEAFLARDEFTRRNQKRVPFDTRTHSTGNCSSFIPNPDGIQSLFMWWEFGGTFILHSKSWIERATYEEDILRTDIISVCSKIYVACAISDNRKILRARGV